MQLIFDGSGSSCYWDSAPGFDLLLALLVDDGHILCRSILTAAHHLRILPLIYFSLLALLAGLPVLALLPYVLTKLAALYSIQAAYYSCYYTCSRAFYSTIYLRAAYAGGICPTYATWRAVCLPASASAGSPLGSLYKQFFCVDSGCSTSTCCIREWFETLDLNAPKVPVYGFGNTVQYSSGVGTVAIPCKAADGTTDIVRLERVLYFPDLPYNLMSVQEVVASGCSIIFSADNSRIQLPDAREIKLLVNS